MADPLVVIVTFPSAQILDVTGPLEVFSSASRFVPATEGGERQPLVDVVADVRDQRHQDLHRQCPHQQHRHRACRLPQQDADGHREHGRHDAHQPEPATARHCAAVVIARSAPGATSRVTPHAVNAVVRPTARPTRATTAVLASSTADRFGLAWKVVRMVLNRYSVVTATAAITITITVANERKLPVAENGSGVSASSQAAATTAVNPATSVIASALHHHGERVDISLMRSTASSVMSSPGLRRCPAQ